MLLNLQTIEIKKDIKNKINNMKHLHTFESYVNNEVNDVNENMSPLNESQTYISNDKFKDEEALKADILKNIYQNCSHKKLFLDQLLYI